jgi:hypothetical protein
MIAPTGSLHKVTEMPVRTAALASFMFARETKVFGD